MDVFIIRHVESADPLRKKNTSFGWCHLESGQQCVANSSSIEAEISVIEQNWLTPLGPLRLQWLEAEPSVLLIATPGYVPNIRA